MTLDFSTVIPGNSEMMLPEILRESDVLPRILYPTKIIVQSMSRIKSFSEIQDLKTKQNKIKTVSQLFFLQKLLGNRKY